MQPSQASHGGSVNKSRHSVVKSAMALSRRGPTQDLLGRAAFVAVLVFLWVMMILLGSIVMESFMIYPNIFHNAPERFDLSLRFMSVTGPAQYFRPLGMVSVLIGAASLVLSWPVKAARWWIAGGVAMIVCEGVISMVYFWPRNTIMFVEGAAVHPVDVLRQTAREFQVWHWSRLTFNAASAVSVFVGFLKLYRLRITQ
jgi:hypothetical protein